VIRLVDQFDDRRRSSTVATPTCGCCCCCCCLATTVTSATLTAVHVEGTAHRKDVERRRRILTTSAAAISPAVVWLVGAFVAPRVIGWDRGTVSFVVTVALAAGAWLAVLVWLYRVVGVHLGGAGSNAALIVVVTAICFGVELFTYGFLFWGQLLAVPVPILAGVYLHRRMRPA
jgi:Kef-type K+ transport system membrane component KefB